ncbi:MAG TPA: CHRD domain-containing protein, partial [Gemmatimonadaceae bacterium]|nr:CHRD domain-containing protein [Gemmatimonadaceae bacterium]
TYTHVFDLTDPASFNSAFIAANGGTLASARAALIAGMFAGQTYTNIHDPQFPGGEISGQLVVATPEPASLVLFGSGLAACLSAMRRRRRRE